MKMVKMSALHTAAFNSGDKSLALTSVRGCVDARAIVLPEIIG
jgi:hypothetical protein